MKSNRASFLFIWLTLVIDAMGYGLILPVMPDLLQEIQGGDLGHAAFWSGILTITFAVTHFLCGPTLGSISDRYGRRPVLLLSLLVMALDFIIMGLAHSIWLLLILRVIGGIAAATQSTAAAFISDISSPENKTANFGIIGAAFGIGFVLGPVIGGLLGEFGHRVPFYAAAGFATLNLILGYFVLPETVTDDNRRAFDWKRSNPIGAFFQIKGVAGLPRLLFIFFLYELAFQVYPLIWAYFTKLQFGWGTGMVGMSLGIFGISIAFVEGYLIRKLVPWLGEHRIILYGFMLNVVIFGYLGFIQSGFWTMILIPISALGAVVVPAMRGLISQCADADEQGEIQGIIASTQALAVIGGPLILSNLFYASTRTDAVIYLPGAPFVLAAFITIITLLVFVIHRQRAQTS